VLPYDRWEGYPAARAEILRFIRDEAIRNVIFLTADTHATLLNQLRVPGDSTAVADEVVVGPIATNTFEAEVRGFASSIGLDPDVAVAQLQGILSLVAHTQCRDLNKDSYAVVQVDAAAGTATITAKDDQGNPVIDTDPIFGTGAACTRTFGP
jgi:phosphodiesterase/alkaline phosphatase D-like protein